MGDISDMMLDGTLCQTCGVYLGPSPDDIKDNYIKQVKAEEWEPCGYPVSCDECE